MIMSREGINIKKVFVYRIIAYIFGGGTLVEMS